MKKYKYMQKLHNKLMDKGGTYAKWHKHPQRQLLQWLVLGLVVFVIGSLLIGRMKNLDSPSYGNLGEASVGSGVPNPSWELGNSSTRHFRIPAPERILEIRLNYNEEAESIIQITKLVQKKGYAPFYENVDGGYRLQTLDLAGNVIQDLGFVVPNEAGDAPPLPGEKPGVLRAKLSRLDFVYTLVWSEQARLVRILDQQGSVLSQSLTKGAEKVDNVPNFHSISGEEFLKEKQKESMLESIFTLTAQAQSSGSTLDIVFIGDNYLTAADLDIFHNDVNRFVNHHLTYEPYKSRASQILFHYIDNTKDLECKHDAVVVRRIDCNQSIVNQTVNSSGVPYDKIVVIVKDDQYGGVGYYGGNAVSYNGSQGQQVYVHEFGHSFPSLSDEYNVTSNNGSLTNAIQQNSC